MQDVVKIIPIILSDGKARRYRTNTKDSPDLEVKLTAIQQTAARFDNNMFHPPVFICLKEEAEKIQQDMVDAEMRIGGIIIEPEDRNTTASVAIAANYAQRYDPNALVLLTLAEYRIDKPKAFRRYIAAATPVVRDGYIVTFGAKHDDGESRHGHIRRGQPLKPGTFLVEKFSDTPKGVHINPMPASAWYYRNSGMYLAQTAMLLKEIDAFEPELSRASKKAFEKAKLSKSMMMLKAKYYRECTPISFDRAIMERTKYGAIIPADIGWIDMSTPIAC